MPPWICSASRVTHSAARHTYALIIDASSVPSPFDIRRALTPDQVGVLNEVYSPTQEQFDKAWHILDAYRKATEHDRAGAVMFGDEMIDEASRKMATKFVTRGERAGLSRSSG